MKKTIFVLAIIAALIIALWKWLTNGENEENKQETTIEEVKEPASEKEKTSKAKLRKHRPKT